MGGVWRLFRERYELDFLAPLRRGFRNQNVGGCRTVAQEMIQEGNSVKVDDLVCLLLVEIVLPAAVAKGIVGIGPVGLQFYKVHPA